MADRLPSTSGVVRTYTGRLVRPLNPARGDISIVDIAHSLSLQCRFAGHVRTFYSVAQHSVAVSHLCGPFALWGLLHDAQEAFLHDLARPIKVLDELAWYCAAEDRLQATVLAEYGLVGPIPPEVHVADDLMLAAEFRDLMTFRAGDEWAARAGHVPPIVPLGPLEAEALFLRRFLQLTEAR